jgi:hypothetical protein
LPLGCKGGSEEVRSTGILNLVHYSSEGCNMGREVMFDGFHFCVYGGKHVFIDGGNIGTVFPHFLLGLCESRGQGIEVGFQVLAIGVGHDEGGKWKGTGGTT